MKFNVICVSLAFAQSIAAAILAIDYGSEWTKAALVKPGIPLEIVLTKDTKRKEQSVIAFKGQERLYGSDAASMAARFPDQTFPLLKTLLGQPYDSSAAREYSIMFPAVKLIETERHSIAFESATGINTVEELVAMEFINMRKNAELMAGEGIREAILTVPVFFDQAQRLALLDSVNLAGLRPLELMNDGLAVAMDYAKGRTFDEPQIHIIFDMGAGSTTATIVRLATKLVKDVGRFNKTVTTIDVLGTGFDSTASGNAMTERLYNFLISEFDDHKGKQVKTPLSDNSRALSRLRKEATRIKQVLSANNEATVSVESLHEDIDFRLKITRTEFEGLTADLAPLAVQPILDALKSAELSTEDVRSLILHGGAARVPFVQRALLGVIEEDKIARNVNADEAAVMGAVFRGAALSGSFRVKEIILQDLSMYSFDYTTESQAEPQQLFEKSSLLDSTRNISLAHKAGDLAVDLYHEQSGISATRKKFATVSIIGVESAISSLSSEYGCKDTTISMSVKLDHSSLVRVSTALASCEVEEKKGVADKLKGWFGAKDNVNTTASTSESDGDEAVPLATASVTKEAPLSVSIKDEVIARLGDADLKSAQENIRKLEKYDNDRVARETARNALEAYVYRVRDFLESESFLEFSTQAEQESLKSLAAAANEWMYDAGEHAEMADLVAKRRGMSSVAGKVNKRLTESASREEKVSALQKQISSSRTFFKSQSAQIDEYKQKKASLSDTKSTDGTRSTDDVVSKPETSDEIGKDASDNPQTDSSIADEIAAPAHTKEELASFEAKIDEIESWLSDKLQQQSVLSKMEDPILLVADIEKKTGQLTDELLSVLMKSNYRQKPKTKPKPTPKANSRPKTKASTSTSTSTSTENADEAVVLSPEDQKPLSETTEADSPKPKAREEL